MQLESRGLILALTFGMAGLCVWGYSVVVERDSLKAQLESAVSERESLISSLRKEIVRKKEQIVALSEHVSAEHTAQASAPQVAATPAAAKSPPAQVTPSSAAQMVELSVAEEMSGIEKLMVLSPDERTLLRESLTRQLESGDTKTNPVAGALGETRFAEYQQKRRDFRAQMRREFEEQELFTLGRKLQLSPEQETQVSDVLSRSRATFFPLDEEETFGRPSKEEMRRILSRELERQRYVTDNLKPVLSDSQYNQYLEMQASSAANQSHTSFLETTEESDSDTSSGK